MKLKFKKQEFQEKAVMSVVDLFRGAKNVPSTFSLQKVDLVDMSKDELLGYGNNLDLPMKGRKTLKFVQSILETRTLTI